MILLEHFVKRLTGRAYHIWPRFHSLDHATDTVTDLGHASDTNLQRDVHLQIVRRSKKDSFLNWYSCPYFPFCYIITEVSSRIKGDFVEIENSQIFPNTQPVSTIPQTDLILFHLILYQVTLTELRPKIQSFNLVVKKKNQYLCTL